jgi:hypothetical protein
MEHSTSIKILFTLVMTTNILLLLSLTIIYYLYQVIEWNIDAHSQYEGGGRGEGVGRVIKEPPSQISKDFIIKMQLSPK